MRFLTRKFDEAMQGLGYRPAQPSDYHAVTIPGKTVMQYLLVLYSKDELGRKLWQASLRGLSPQLGLEF